MGKKIASYWVKFEARFTACLTVNVGMCKLEISIRLIIWELTKKNVCPVFFLVIVVASANAILDFKNDLSFFFVFQRPRSLKNLEKINLYLADF